MLELDVRNEETIEPAAKAVASQTGELRLIVNVAGVLHGGFRSASRRETLPWLASTRIAPHAIVVGLHPGTLDTDLSKPFQRNLPEQQLLSPRTSVHALLEVIAGLEREDSGKLLDFRGQESTP